MERRLSFRSGGNSKKKKTFHFKSLHNFFLLCSCFAPFFPPCSSFSSTTLSAVCLWINAFEFPLKRDALWVFNEDKKWKKKKKERTTIAYCDKYMKNQRKTNGSVARRASVVVSVIKYTTNNNKSDTWHEKYIMILLREILHFWCLRAHWMGGRRMSSSSSKSEDYSDSTRITEWFEGGTRTSSFSHFFLVWNVIFFCSASKRWLLILCGCCIAYLWPVISSKLLLLSFVAKFDEFIHKFSHTSRSSLVGACAVRNHPSSTHIMLNFS